MANTTTKRKTTGKSQTSRKKTNTRTQAKSQSVSERFQVEIILMIILGASILMFISNLGLGGFVGSAISTYLFGSMGLLAYLFPFLFFFCALFIAGNKGNRLAKKKIFAGILLCAVLCGLLQHITEGYMESLTLADYFARSSDYHTGGGVVGGALCISTTSAFGLVGSYVILVMVLLICLIEITQRSFFGFFFHLEEMIKRMIQGGRDRYQEGQPERDMRREIRERERARRRQERQQERLKELEQALAEEDEESEEALPRRKRKSLEPVTVAPTLERPGQEEPVIHRTDTLKKAVELKPKRRSRKAAAPEESNEEFEELRETRKNMDENEEKASARKVIRQEDSQEQMSAGQRAMQAEEISDLQDSFFDEEPEEEENLSFSIRRPEPAYLEEDDAEDFYLGEDISQNSYRKASYESEAQSMEAYPADSYEDSNVGASAEDSYDEMVEGEQGSPMTPTHRQPQKNPKSSKEEIESGVQNIESEIQQKEAIPAPKYHYPPLKLLKRGDGRNQGDSDEHLKKTAQKLEETLRNFGVNVTVTNVSCGPTVTQYELQPEMGVKVSRIVSLADDIKLNLAAADIRIEAPIPGKAAVGIEVPNKENSPVMLRDLLQSQEFQGASSRLSFAVGKDIAGKPVVTDIAKMPHLLIAGSTGSGKSVCINTLIASILYKASPEEVKLIMIDPKVVELSVYNGIPHLLIPVVTDPKKAAGALNWAVQEMTQRYNTFAEFSVRKLEEYNHKVENMRVPEGEERPKKMPQIVVIVDELADLMMVAPGEVEDAIVRLTQLARAAGIHLVIATQRPSVNVITGLIKANMPSRIAFAVSSGTDSRVILDSNGAEKLLGKGDMLFYPQGYPKPARLQGAFISDEEVSSVVEFLSNRNPAVEYSSAIEEQVNTAVAIGGGGSASSDRDVYFEEAGKFIIEKEKASIGMLQRMFKIGFNRAARIMDQLCDAGVVGPEEGTKPRKVLMSQSEFESYLEEH